MMPTDSGGIPAVAVSKRTSNYINSAYTILMILIVSVGWKLILALILKFWPTKGEPNRVVALVALWNSSESMNGMMAMLSYCGMVIRRPSSKTPGSILDGSNLSWGLLFLFLAFSLTFGNILAGILVPVQLSMGNVAPPAKKAIFYPDVALYSRTDDNGAGQSKLDSLKAPSALRALGSVEAADDDVSVRDRVHIENRNSGGSAYLSYNYNVTGVDMGLQTDPTLTLLIKGACRTDDTWLVNSTDEGDTYKLFGGDDTYLVKYQPQVDLPPMVHFELDPKSPKSNISYAMIVSTGGLLSYTSGQDPWYATNKTEGAAIAYQVRRRRPVLICWEVTRWRLNGKEVDNSGLPTLPGLKLAKFWSTEVFSGEFGVPRVVSVGKAAGTNALKSASFAVAPYYILDAGASNIIDDLKRLVLASWVSSRNVVRDTTTYNRGSLVNLAAGAGGSLKPGVEEFVLQGGDIVTLSVRILIAVPAILLFLLIVNEILRFVLKHSDRFEEDSVFKDFYKDKEKTHKVKNAVALLAIELYARLDKEKNKDHTWDHSGLTAFPFVSSVSPSLEEGSSTGQGPDEKSEAGIAAAPLDNGK